MNAAAVDPLALPMVSGLGAKATDNDGRNPEALRLITFHDVRALVDNPQQVEKPRSQWLIPSTHRSRKNHDKNGKRPVIWADLDNPTTTIQQTADIVRGIVKGCDFEVYASFSATAAKQKCRILVPVKRGMPPEQWIRVSEVFLAKLEAAGIEADPASKALGQVLYLPNRGKFYDTASARNGDLFEPLDWWELELEQRAAELEQQRKEQQQAQEAARTRREALQAARSTSGFKSPIDAFNAAYDVAEILTRNGYTQRGETFRHPASATGSYSARVRIAAGGDRRVHSLSTSDPLYTGGKGGDGAHDAFSAFCVLEHGGNREAAIEDAADNWLTIGGESWNKVQRREWAKQQQEQQRNAAALADFGQTFPPLADPDTGELVTPEPPRPLLVPVDVAGVWTDPSPPTEFIWGEYLPRGTTTLFAAHGGTGKSTIGLMLAVATAVGLPLLGVPTKAAPAIFVSLEDGARIVRDRLGRICRWLNVEPARLAGRLFILDGTENPELYQADNRNKAGEESRAYAELLALVQSTGAGLVLIDNASDAYGGDEIVRRQVRGFIRSLNLIAQHGDAAVMLLAHVDKTTSRAGKSDNGEGYSGSTAWHNSVRSRLFLSRDKDTKLLTLEHQKGNLAKQCHEPLLIVWPDDGFPQAYAAPEGGGVDFGALAERADGRQQDKNAAELIKLLAEFESRGQYASPAASAKTNVFALLRADPQFKRLKLGKDAVSAIVTQCQRAGWIEAMSYRADYKDKQRWTVTDKGREWAGLAVPPSPPSPPSCQDGG